MQTDCTPVCKNFNPNPLTVLIGQPPATFCVHEYQIKLLGTDSACGILTVYCMEFGDAHRCAEKSGGTDNSFPFSPEEHKTMSHKPISDENYLKLKKMENEFYRRGYNVVFPEKATAGVNRLEFKLVNVPTEKLQYAELYLLLTRPATTSQDILYGKMAYTGAGIFIADLNIPSGGDWVIRTMIKADGLELMKEGILTLPKNGGAKPATSNLLNSDTNGLTNAGGPLIIPKENPSDPLPNGIKSDAVLCSPNSL
ncbi:hypothetical protein CHS0354_018373 [Potamilus streckersoni]|uniref:Uncharacterized protein n=1 Tax=Potamilus streckersoni TaxID=2493646 RepID=A0AAE0WA69_9BIVA|nr:hypothetical protein CHS0354_018373 [Potamilus streckersoni]